MSMTVRPLSTAGMRTTTKALVPFAENPTADHYFPSEVHEEALARLLYLVEEQDSCGILTGPPGSGKSTLLLRVQQQLRRSGWKACRIDLAGIDHSALLHRIAVELGANPASGVEAHELWDQIELMIASAARVQQPCVLLFDHADRLRPGALSLLEQLLHTQYPEGLVMLFASRNEVRTPLLKTLREHSGLRIELPPLTVNEAQCYIEYALDQGWEPTVEFSHEASQLVGRLTAGIPRQINRMCRTLILAAQADRQLRVGTELVLSVAEELLDLQAVS